MGDGDSYVVVVAGAAASHVVRVLKMASTVAAPLVGG